MFNFWLFIFMFFCSFSWHEFGIYDTAATIDYILSLTGQSQVSLVGHSMGSTMQLVLLSNRPEYNSKVNVVLAFAPVAIVTHSFPGLFTSAALRYGNRIEVNDRSIIKYKPIWLISGIKFIFIDYMKEALRLLNMHEAFPRDSLNLKNYGRLCQSPNTRIICQRLVLYLLGLTNFEEFDMVR